MRQLPNTTHLKRRVRRVCHERPNALAAIRDGKLYKADHATFEDYCKVRWGWARNYANKMIAAAEVTRSLGTNVPSPATESQARPLTKLPPAEQADAWEEVVAESEQTGEKITAKKVEQVVAKRRGKNIPKKTWKGVDLRDTAL